MNVVEAPKLEKELTEEEAALVAEVRRITGHRVQVTDAEITYVCRPYRESAGNGRSFTISFSEFPERKHALREAVMRARHDHDPRPR